MSKKMTELSHEEIEMYRILDGLHEKWVPHPVQIDIGHELFYKGTKNIFICGGRNMGKTDFCAYAETRWAQQYPNTQNYIFEPFQKQAREILWSSRRIQDFGPKEWLHGEPNNTELRVNFKNGSFIKLEGSDNVAAIAGIKPKGLIVYDEFKDHRIESIRNFEPNRAAFDVPAIFIGTPPEFHNHFVDYMEMAKNSPDWVFIHAPTSANPHISKLWLEKMKRQLISMGEYEEWLRSYEAIYVKGGKRTIYPWVLTATKHKLEDILPVDLNKWRIVVALDPAATSIFGVVFAFWNEYTKKLIVFDEIYESDSSLMTSRKIYAAIKEKLAPWKDKVRGIDWVYDEAAAYFRSEMSEIDQSIWMTPSSKSEFGIEGYINLVRNVMNHGLLQVTENCTKFWFEHENYIKDENNHIPKANDHLINAFQYLCGKLGLNFNEIDEPKTIAKDERRAYRIEEEINIVNDYSEID
jgi:hypothetical protein